MSLEFVRYSDGSCALTDAGEVQWSSDNDEDFQAEFGDRIEPEDVDNVIDWLEDAGYIEDGEAMDIVDHDDDWPDDEADDYDDDDEEDPPWLH